MSLPPASGRRLAPGVVVAERYVVERLIGRGGMGEVWEASDPKLGRSVALKIVAGSASPAAKRRLELEAKAIGSLDHPGIAMLHDVVEQGDALVLVMELIRGTSLRESLQAGPVSPKEVARIVRGTAEALTAAHARGLVHRDVKPDNVLVRTDGRTVLLDFGVAKAVTSDEQDALAATMTGEGAMMGTPAYVAPEQIRGAAVSGATDQFGLAVMAFELLTGQLPWTGNGVPAIIASISSDVPRSVGDGLAEARDGVDDVFARALAKSPAKRFPDVIAFADALGAALSASPTPSGPPRPSTTNPEERRDLVTTADAPGAAPEKRTGWRTWVGGAVAVGLIAGGAWFIAGRGGRGDAVPTSASSGAAASPRGVGWRELEMSGAKSEEQRAAARTAASAFGRGEMGTARGAIDGVLAKDPDFPGGQLLRAYLSFVLAADLDEPARAALASAVAHRDRLSARDAALLAALEPSFLDPPRWHETADALEAFTKARPRDGQGWDALGFARTKLGDHPAAERAFTAELEIDPGAAGPLIIMSMILVERGEEERAKGMLEACIRRDGSTTSCRITLGRLLASMGSCDEADRVGRDALALAPTAANALSVRATANAGSGAPNDVIASFLDARLKLVPAERAASERLQNAYVLAARIGDFPAALAALDMTAAAAQGANAAEVTGLAVARIRTLWEMDERQKAADEAETFLRQMATRKVPERAGSDPTGVLLAFLRASGRISAEVHAQRRDAWIAGWHARRSETEWKIEGGGVWASAYASADTPTPEAARAALEKRDAMGVEVRSSFGAAPEAIGTERTAIVGSLLLAAGREKEAERYLVIAANACRIMPDHRARLALADVYTQRGDKARACAAYDAIELAWGHAKPRSVTAEAARAAAKKLGCSSPPR